MLAPVTSVQYEFGNTRSIRGGTRVQIIVFLSFFILLQSLDALAADGLMAQHWKAKEVLQSVVAVMDSSTATGEWYIIGTAVILDVDDTDPQVYLVTNKHVVAGRDHLRLDCKQFTQQDSLATYEEFTLSFPDENLGFSPHGSDTDIFILPVPRQLGSNRLLGILPEGFCRLDDLGYGDVVDFWGYPNYGAFQLQSLHHNFPILRGGFAAFFPNRDIRKKNGKRLLLKGEFLIDGISMGGNSGGPVFRRVLKTEKIPNVKERYYFAGIVRGHLKLPDDLVDSVTIGPIESVSVIPDSSNAQLAIVVSTDLILEYIESVRALRKTESK